MTEPHRPNFDRVARAYRWMEYLALGTALERARHFHLDAGRLDGCERALVLGDGDGRFTARLLRRNSRIVVDAVDLSAEMLRLLAGRCEFAAGRLRVCQTDARAFRAPNRLRAAGPFNLSAAPGPDLVATHFFLDCLTDLEVRELVQRIAPTLAPGARWLVSEFRIPEGWMKWPARVLVRGLYLAFRLLTGLRVNRLPDHAFALRASGLQRVAEERFLGGMVVAELWVVPRATTLGIPEPTASSSSRNGLENGESRPIAEFSKGSDGRFVTGI